MYLWQWKTSLTSFKFKNSIPKYLCWHIVESFCLVAATQYIINNWGTSFIHSLEHLRLTFLTEECIKKPKNSSINNHILLKGHNANYDKFFIFLNERIVFKLHLKEPLSIKKDQPELNKNAIYSYPQGLFDWLLYYYIVILLTINHYKD